jgi:surface antigen
MTTERWANAGGGRRPESGNAAAWATAAEDMLMGYRANERGKLSGYFIAAGDGLEAFGAALILPVQTH